MIRFIIAAAALLALAPAALAGGKPETTATINYAGFRALTGEVEAYRQTRLVPLDQFQAMGRQAGTLILDARSADAYREGHIEGAVNLPFTDFTDASLAAAIGAPGRRVLIYCNNNFANNTRPVVMKRLELALNIQTFINLYGYGYRNVYELGEVVDFNDPAVGWVRGAEPTE